MRLCDSLEYISVQGEDIVPYITREYSHNIETTILECDFCKRTSNIGEEGWLIVRPVQQVLLRWSVAEAVVTARHSSGFEYRRDNDLIFCSEEHLLSHYTPKT